MFVSDDLLAKWKRPGFLPSSVTAPRALRTYSAFAEGSAPMLWLKTAPREPEQGLPYGYLTRVRTDTWGFIGLTFAIPFPNPVIVEIKGECLEPLIEAIMRKSAAWIQVMEPSWFVAPADGSPIVSEILVHDKPPEIVPVELKH